MLTFRFEFYRVFAYYIKWTIVKVFAELSRTQNNSVLTCELKDEKKKTGEIYTHTHKKVFVHSR